MKYYSEVLKKIFDSEQDCAEAEEAQKKKEEEAKLEAEKKASERKARAAEVEEAMKQATAASARYRKLLKKFCEDYGAFHYTMRPKDSWEDIHELLDLWF